MKNYIFKLTSILFIITSKSVKYFEIDLTEAQSQKAGKENYKTLLIKRKEDLKREINCVYRFEMQCCEFINIPQIYLLSLYHAKDQASLPFLCCCYCC